MSDKKGKLGKPSTKHIQFILFIGTQGDISCVVVAHVAIASLKSEQPQDLFLFHSHH